MIKKLLLLLLPVFTLMTSFTAAPLKSPTRCGSYFTIETGLGTPKIEKLTFWDLNYGTLHPHYVPFQYDPYLIPATFLPGHYYQLIFSISSLSSIDNTTYEVRIKNQSGIIIERLEFSRSSHGAYPDVTINNFTVACETYHAYVRKKSDPDSW